MSAGSGLADNFRTARHGCYAHFPGTGPAGQTCRQCVHAVDANKTPRKQAGPCAKWRELMPEKIRQQPIPYDASACRYFKTSDE